jgi:hypothetical protein
MPANRTARARLLAALVVLAVFVVACGGKGKSALEAPTSLGSTTTSTPPPPATTTTIEGPKSPLTGLVATDPASLTRSALIVKIDNADGAGCDDAARPQIGISHADIVYEILVEGITRFMAVFQSDIPATVGPVRSARSSDVDLIAMFNTPMFAWSGNNDNVSADLSKVRGRYVDVGHSSSAGGSFYRDSVRCAPHNLLVNPADLYDYAADKKAGVPTPIFTYRATGAALPATARATGGVHLTTGGDVVYVWDAQRNGWDRNQKGTPHLAADGKDNKDTVPISPANVVVLEVTYANSSTPGSPLAVTLGKGKAHVYTAGKVIDGTWSRDENGDPWTLTDEAGAPITLTPGKTWVALSQKDKAQDLDAAAAAKFLKS